MRAVDLSYAIKIWDMTFSPQVVRWPVCVSPLSYPLASLIYRPCDGGLPQVKVIHAGEQRLPLLKISLAYLRVKACARTFGAGYTIFVSICTRYD